jgi:RNA polymerase sigma factor (sigma-70 family)
MPATPQCSVVRHLRRFLDTERLRAVPDAELLSRFTAAREEIAFAALLQRYGPLVFGVCRRVLAGTHDAEDAFQATFLVLVRHAGKLRQGGSLASWLYTVAYRIALKARGSAARRRLHEGRFEPPPAADPTPDVERRELCVALDEELSRLPEKYRAPIVLCGLQGLTHQEAARALGCPAGSISKRLARAQELLRGRLTRRGVTLSAGLLAALLADCARAVTPSALAADTLRVVGLAAAGGAALPAPVASLAEGAVRQAWSAKLNTGLAALFAICLFGAAGGLLAARQAHHDEPLAEKPAHSEGEKPALTDDAESPLPPGALARLGTSRFRHAHIVSGSAFSPDGKSVATGSHLGTIRIWEAATGKLLREFKAQTGVASLAYSPDGKVLASSCWYGPILLWDPETGKQVRALKGFDGHTSTVTFSPDGKTLASGGKDKNVRLWDVDTGAQTGLLEGHKDEVRCVAFSPDGGSVVSCSLDKTVRIWDAKTGKERRQFEGHDAAVQSVAYAPDGKTIASGGNDSMIRVWDAKTGERLHEAKHIGWVESLAFSSDGKSLAASTGWGGQVHCWDVEGKWDKPRWSARNLQSLRVSFSGDGKKLAAGSWHNTVRIWDTATGKEEGAARAPGHEGWVYDLCFLPEGKTLISAGSDGRIIVWDAGSGREVRRMEGHQSLVWCLAISPDGKTLASGSDDQTVRLWDLATGKEVRQFKSAGAVKSVAFSPDGARLASASGEDLYPTWKNPKPAEACVWDVASGERLFRLEGHEGGVKSVAYSPDGKLIATGGNDKTVRLWDADTGKERRRLTDHRGAVEAVAFSPDGRTLASADGRVDPTKSQTDGAIRLWEVATGEKLREFDAPAEWFVRLAFSPDGRTLAATVRESKRQGNSVFVWEVATGKGRRSYPAHQGTAYAVAFAPDGRRLASGGADDAILVWDVTGRMEKGRLAAGKLSDAELEAAWADLAGKDSVKAYEAVWSLVAAPGDALPLLRKTLRPAEAIDAKRLARLLKELDDDDFDVREKAAAELEKQGEPAAEALRKLLKDGAPSAEVRVRAGALLEKLSGQGDSGERPRRERALEVLEQLGTAEAGEVLESLARGAPDAPQTQQARAALKRLDKKGKAPEVREESRTK